MVKCFGSRRSAACWRRTRAAKAWKVWIQTEAARPGARASTRLRISPAALLVKVTAKRRVPGTPSDKSRAIR